MQFPCPKKMQINLTGFLNGKNARQFMDELWALLLSAQESEMGIPEEFIQQKKDEIMKREEDSKLLDQLKGEIEADILSNLREQDARSKSKERRDNNNGRASNHRDSSGSPLPGPPRKQTLQSKSAEVTALSESIAKAENGVKGKRSRSAEQSKDNSGKISTSRQRSRDRSVEKSSKNRHTSPAADRSRHRSRNKSRDRSRRRSTNRNKTSRSRSRSKSRSRGRGRKSSSKSRSSAIKKSGEVPSTASTSKRTIADDSHGAGLSKIQSKLLTMADGNKKANRSPSSRSRSHSRSDKSSSRSRSR